MRRIHLKDLKLMVKNMTKKDATTLIVNLFFNDRITDESYSLMVIHLGDK